MGLGRRSIHDLTRDDIIIPEGFEKRFGQTTS
jgi:L-lactate dehydrogenase (cytochrome)/glycolate oxidase